MRRSPTLAGEFLEAFVRVEKLLRSWLDPGSSMSFPTLVDAAARARPAVRRYGDDLKEFAQLRNAIVHEPGGGHPIADPYPETVETLVRIVELLERPPRLVTVAGRGAGPGGRVEICHPDEPVGVAARRMHAGDFSQLPVYEGGRLIALLTAAAITRWLGARLETGGGHVDEAPIREVLDMGADPGDLVVLGTDATAFDALALFEEYTAQGRRLDAIVITDGGRSDRPPAGIVTVYDIPRLHRALSPRRRRRPKRRAAEIEPPGQEPPPSPATTVESPSA